MINFMNYSLSTAAEGFVQTRITEGENLLKNIREKIEINPKEPKYLKVVWGQGYKIEKGAR